MTSSGWPPPNGSFDPQSYPPPQPAWPPPTATPGTQPAWPQNNWQQDGWTTGPALSYGTPLRPKRRKWPFVVIGVVVVLVLAGIGVGINVFVQQTSGAKKAAATYLTALARGDFDAAYDQWCAQDQSVYPAAAFRAQHESRQGEFDTVRGVAINSSTDSGTTAYVDFGSPGGPVDGNIALRKVHGTWQVCPTGDRLSGDLSNCTCMTASQHLEADIAFVLNKQRAEYPLNRVQCPVLSVLVDGQPVLCRGISRDGRSWDIRATESNNATYTNVEIGPATT